MKLLLVFIIVAFSACSKKHDEIKIVNKSDRDLLYEYSFSLSDKPSQVDSVKYYIRGSKEKVTNKTQIIFRVSDAFVDASFETYIKKSKKGYLELFVFNYDTMLKYKEGYKIFYIIENKLYDQKLKLTTDTLNKLNWTLTIK